jgi:hypothetical protein
MTWESAGICWEVSINGGTPVAGLFICKGKSN